MDFLLALMTYAKKHDLTFQILTNTAKEYYDFIIYYKNIEQNKLESYEISMDERVCRKMSWEACFIALVQHINERFGIVDDMLTAAVEEIGEESNEIVNKVEIKEEN